MVERFSTSYNSYGSIDELKSIDKKLLRYLTVKVKNFDLDTNYFVKKDDVDKKESAKH